ncbi:MAG TPA: helix-turn-helix domain-containing protein [Streptosporangiaceae bacterium]|nr:helix-turn-helix domain-containing protein [Streptosporangiaceae bacterium]
MPERLADPVMTTKEAAEYLKLSVRTLLRLRVDGGGPAAAKIGRQWRYRRSQLDAWLAEREREGQ